MAPEVMNCRNAGKSSDMWSIGVVTYMLLSGQKMNQFFYMLLSGQKMSQFFKANKITFNKWQ